MAADIDKIIQWQLRCLTEHASDLNPSDLDWTIKMEDAYKKQGFLTKRQQEVLEEIYKRY